MVKPISSTSIAGLGLVAGLSLILGVQSAAAEASINMTGPGSQNTIRMSGNHGGSGSIYMTGPGSYNSIYSGGQGWYAKNSGNNYYTGNNKHHNYGYAHTDKSKKHNKYKNVDKKRHTGYHYSDRNTCDYSRQSSAYWSQYAKYWEDYNDLYKMSHDWNKDCNYGHSGKKYVHLKQDTKNHYIKKDHKKQTHSKHHTAHVSSKKNYDKKRQHSYYAQQKKYNSYDKHYVAPAIQHKPVKNYQHEHTYKDTKYDQYATNANYKYDKDCYGEQTHKFDTRRNDYIRDYKQANRHESYPNMHHSKKYESEYKKEYVKAEKDHKDYQKKQHQSYHQPSHYASKRHDQPRYPQYGNTYSNRTVNNNEVEVSNNVRQYAQTGDAVVSGNTYGGSATTGDAANYSTVDVAVNIQN